MKGTDKSVTHEASTARPVSRHDPDWTDPDISWANERDTSLSRLDLLSMVPLLSIIALAILVAGVVWVVGRHDNERARTKIATDALWVEQTLRFQLSIGEDMLVRMVLEAAGGTTEPVLDTRARLHLAANPEVLSVDWYDREGQRIRMLRGGDAPDDPQLVEFLRRLEGRASRPIYGAIQADGAVSMGVALLDDSGFITATMSLPLLLERHVPWWIAEQYGVRLHGSNGSQFASRQRLEPAENNASHTISFEPPLRGAFLTITAYDTSNAVRSAMLLGAIGALAVFAVLALAVLFRNASRRRMAERRLRAETAFRRSMEESLTVGLRAKDHSGRILYVNAAFCNIVGWQPDELIGHPPPMPYWDPNRLAETAARHRQLEAAGAITQSFETGFRHRDGHEIDIQVYEAPLIDAGGVHRGWMGSIIDITEQKRTARLARLQDETMAHTGRLVTLGEMASTLAHELNQPLAAIASYAAGISNLLQRDGFDTATLQQANDKLATQASRAGQIIRRIQDLVKKRDPNFALIRLDEVIAETLSFLSSDAREHRVRLEADISLVPPVMADTILLEQVLINLIRNGMEAMADQRSGDILRIRLTSDDGQAIITVTDQGPGIAPEIAGNLFEAFASTKSQGMGMGLKISRSIIELHRGQLYHYPVPDGGTEFRISIPLASDPPETKETTP